jgi:hypothetical protein
VDAIIANNNDNQGAAESPAAPSRPAAAIAMSREFAPAAI